MLTSSVLSKRAARKFVEQWTFRRGSEKGEDQQFWNSLLGDVLGMSDVASRIQYQVPVPMKGTTKFLDAWIPETRVLIEHKSRGVNLDAPQSGHGGLFDGASESEIPPLTEEIAKLLDGSSGFDWSGISPTIFGALFESTLNPETRRSGGMHYTSIENIHKLIDPLFLDDLTRRVDSA